MTSVKPKNEWLSPTFILAVMLALLNGQQAYSNFNNTTSVEIAVLKERVSALMAQRCGGRQ